MPKRKPPQARRRVSRLKRSKPSQAASKPSNTAKPQLHIKAMPDAVHGPTANCYQPPAAVKPASPASGIVKRIRLSAGSRPLEVSASGDAPSRQPPQLRIQRLRPPKQIVNPQFQTVLNGLKPGTQWGQYVITRPIQMGLTGATYEAERSGTRTRVALKFLDVPWNEESCDRFMDCAARIKALRHDSICSLLEYYWQPPYMVLVYELLAIRNGPALTLEDYCLRYIPKGSYPDEREVLKIAYQLVSALAEAHNLELIHGDLKPGNLLFCQAPSDDGSLRLRMKITDTGCAQILGEEALAHKLEPVLQSADDADLPSVATAAFMSPEQLKGAPAGKQSDIFSAAAVIHYFLTRSWQVKRKKPSARRSGIHAAWDPVICKALRTDPERRYESADDFADCLSIIEVPRR